MKVLVFLDLFFATLSRTPCAVVADPSLGTSALNNRNYLLLNCETFLLYSISILWRCFFRKALCYFSHQTAIKTRRNKAYIAMRQCKHFYCQLHTWAEVKIQGVRISKILLNLVGFGNYGSCGLLSPPPNAMMSHCTRGARRGSRCTIRCEDGFRQEQAVRNCRCSGLFCSWAGNNPNCGGK